MPVATDVIIRRMYEAPPDGFVAARSAAIADAKKAGDKEAVRRLTALRKPTVAAWLVNLLALRKPELIDQLVELAGELRTAQRTLQGDELRELSTQRRQIVSALVSEARKLAVAEDRGLAGKLPLGEVEATLTAAMSEPEIAAQVRSGRLVRATSYAGFGEVPRPRLRLVTDSDAAEILDEHEELQGDDEPAPSKREQAAAERRRREFQERRRELRKELTAAQAAEQRADDQVEKAEAAEREANHLVEDLDNELAELERRRAEAQADVARRKQARRAAEREAAAARRRVGDAEAALEDLDASAPD
jgi:hypothetical protein